MSCGSTRHPIIYNLFACVKEAFAKAMIHGENGTLNNNTRRNDSYSMIEIESCVALYIYPMEDSLHIHLPIKGIKLEMTAIFDKLACRAIASMAKPE